MKAKTATIPPPSRLQRVKQGGLQALPQQAEQRIVSIDRLIENPSNERQTYRNMEGLIATVKAMGIIEPLIVEPTDNNHFMIIVGHRRFRAAQAAGLKKVPIIVGQSKNGTLRRRKSIITNVQREDVGPVEMAEGLRALLDEDEQIETQRQVAELIGKRESWVSDILRILTLPPALQRKLRTSEVSVPYDAVMRIARVQDEADQRGLVKAVLKGATNREIRQQIDAIKGKLSPTTAKKPKAVYSTNQGATVIVQSLTEELTPEQNVAALQEALRKARNQLQKPQA